MASSTSSSISTSPAIRYPTGLPIINYLDTVVVLYETPWTALANLSVNCYVTPTALELYGKPAGNPIHESGTYVWSRIGGYLAEDIAQFPTDCYFNLYPNIASDGKGVLGGNFTMISTSGEPRTWAASTTNLPPTPTTNQMTTSFQTTSATSVTQESSPSVPAAAPTSSPSTTPLSLPSGFSTGAKAGIGVGAAASSLLLSALIYIIILLRRLSNGNRRRPEQVGNPLRHDSGPADTYLHNGIPIYEKCSEPGTRV